MTLDEKIAHLDDAIRYHEECRNEYIQLRDWLKELKTYKEQQNQKTKRQEYIEAYCDHCGFSLNYWTMQHDIANCGMECNIKNLIR